MESRQSTIAALLEQLRQHKISRRHFIATLSALGATASAISTLLIVTKQLGHQEPAPPTSSQQQIEQHDQHLTTRQNAPTISPEPTNTPDATNPAVEQHIQQMLQDYHPDAIFVDALLGYEIVGHAAIAAHKRAEFFSMRGVRITVTHRFVAHDDLVAEWLAEGTHVGDLYGLPASGRSFAIHGLTVVTRRAGKIVKEALYYDLAEVRRQLTI